MKPRFTDDEIAGLHYLSQKACASYRDERAFTEACLVSVWKLLEERADLLAFMSAQSLALVRAQNAMNLSNRGLLTTDQFSEVMTALDVVIAATTEKDAE